MTSGAHRALADESRLRRRDPRVTRCIHTSSKTCAHVRELQLPAAGTFIASKSSPHVMGAFRILPVDVIPLVACVSAGCGFLAYSAFRTAFYSGEVHLTNRTRADELQENEIAEEKGKEFYKTSMYLNFGKIFNTPPGLLEPTFCKPDEH
eukprot:jgi/Ulvmu1/7290/UM035_0078.1